MYSFHFVEICKVRAFPHGSIEETFGGKITENSFVLDNSELIFTCYKGYEKYANGYEPPGIVKCVDGTLHPGQPECRPRKHHLFVLGMFVMEYNIYYEIFRI